MRFVDVAEIWVKAGDGGRGCVSFNREKFRPKGGPDGGDGGRGGDILVVADERLHTLLDLKYQPQHEAGRGEHGMGKQMNGRAGESHTIRVPVGTVLRDQATGQQLADLTQAGQQVVVAAGGRGGLGNMNFATPTRQAPRFAQPGEPGDERTLQLELKLIADVGLLGLPNVGKSTLISVVSAARPKIADYPFTTLVPHLGVVGLSDERSFVMADIPGLVPGAHAGKGLGDQFLRHVERVKVLAHLVSVTPGDERDPRDDFAAINEELRLYNAELATRPQVLVLTKIDLPEAAAWRQKLSRFAAKQGLPFVAVSAVQQKGLPALLEALWRILAPR